MRTFPPRDQSLYLSQDDPRRQTTPSGLSYTASQYTANWVDSSLPLRGITIHGKLGW